MSQEIRSLEMKLKIGRYIFQCLSFTPWNTTSAFLSPENEREMNEAANPLGRDEGFSFLKKFKQVGAEKLTKTPGAEGLGSSDQRNLHMKDIDEMLSFPRPVFNAIKVSELVNKILGDPKYK